MTARNKAVWLVILGSMLASLGCASREAVPSPSQMLCPMGATTAQVVNAAHDVLARMHFPIEKLDVEQGIVRTRPLRAGQFFEFWQRDNMGTYNTIEANVQSIRRTVELRVKAEAADRRPEAGNASSLQPTASGLLCIECDVHVQRLALPGNEVAGVSQAYQIHTRSEPTLQVFDVTPQQRQGMAWIDLGGDPGLAAEILRRIEQRLERPN